MTFKIQEVTKLNYAKISFVNNVFSEGTFLFQVTAYKNCKSDLRKGEVIFHAETLYFPFKWKRNMFYVNLRYSSTKKFGHIEIDFESLVMLRVCCISRHLIKLNID